MADDALANYLAQRDVPCPSCGYNLRALTAQHCPECNSELTLAVRLADPRQAAWVTALVATAVMLGFHGVMGAYFAAELLRRGRRMGQAHLGFTMWAFAALAGILLALLIWQRRRYCRASAPVQAALTATALLLAIVSFLVFFAQV